MDKLSSSQLLPVTARAELQSVEKIAHDDQKKTIHAKEDVSRIIGWILRGGVILSATIILIGFLLLLIHIGEQPGFAISIGAFPHSLSQVWSGLLVLQSQAIIAAGLLLLIVTPVITVITALVAFAIKRDLRFVVITCVVLAILLTSMLIGKGG
jgi:uncharacterized membrane protein